MQGTFKQILIKSCPHVASNTRSLKMFLSFDLSNKQSSFQYYITYKYIILLTLRIHTSQSNCSEYETGFPHISVSLKSSTTFNGLHIFRNVTIISYICGKKIHNKLTRVVLKYSILLKVFSRYYRLIVLSPNATFPKGQLFRSRIFKKLPRSNNERKSLHSFFQVLQNYYKISQHINVCLYTYISFC